MSDVGGDVKWLAHARVHDVRARARSCVVSAAACASVTNGDTTSPRMIGDEERDEARGFSARRVGGVLRLQRELDHRYCVGIGSRASRT